MKFKTLAFCAFALLSSACLENEEEFEVRRDGSVTVRLTARGKAEDMAGGYPIPLAGPWSPIGDDSRLWTSVIGPDTGSRTVQKRIAEGLWSANADDPERSVVLAVEGHFAAAEDIPTRFAPLAEPYREAYLERSASLAIERKSGRTVYVFERRFHSRGRGPSSIDDQARAQLSDELKAKLEEGGPFTDEDKLTISSAYMSVVRQHLDRVVRAALSEIYTAGDGSVPLSAVMRTVERTMERLRMIVDGERMATAWNELERLDRLKKEGVDLDARDPFDGFEDEIRDTLRNGIRTLSSEGVEEPIVNGILFRLESLFTADDHTSDLADEKFKVSVAMPGIVLAGNYSAIEGARVSFEFEGKSLANQDIILRVISVEE